MSEVQVVERTTPAVNAAAKKRRGRKRLRSILIAVLVVLLIAAAAFAVWWFVFRERAEPLEVLKDTAYRSSIASMVSGSGTAMAATSETIVLSAPGTVLEVYVTDGDVVTEGDPLYVIDSAAANKSLTDAEDRVLQRQESLTRAYAGLETLHDELDDILSAQAQSEADRVLIAPFSGQMRDAADLAPGDTVTKGMKLTRLVDDRTFKLSLYFSYAFEHDIYEGQPAHVTITGGMANLAGTVDEIRRVRRVTPEGATLFEVVVTLENPGALTDGMSATASLTTAGGTPIYPYEGGTLAFYRSFDVLAKTTGEVLTTNLLSYGDCEAGGTLVVLSAEDFSQSLQSKRDAIKTFGESITAAEEALAEAQQELERARQSIADLSAHAPMSGTVLSCSLRPGEEVDTGRAAISIADISVMTVDINIDERNFAYIKPGMPIQLNDWYGNFYFGEVISVSLIAKNESGITSFPATVRVDNSMGTLMSGTTLEYQFTAAQSEDCIVIPIQCVYYVPAGDGSNQTVVLLEADEKPAHAFDLPPELAQNFPEGFYAVPVVTGLSDTMHVEVKEGLNEGDVVFTNYITNQSNGWGYY